jgi:CRISPR-associated protein Csd2
VKPGATGTLGRKHTVAYGLYKCHGFVNPVFAEKTKFSDDDLAVLWRALNLMFDLDRSAARGLMTTRALYIFKHESKLGSASADKLFGSVSVKLKEGVVSPRSFSDYIVTGPEASALPKGVTLIDGCALSAAA